MLSTLFTIVLFFALIPLATTGFNMAVNFASPYVMAVVNAARDFYTGLTEEADTEDTEEETEDDNIDEEITREFQPA